MFAVFTSYCRAGAWPWCVLDNIAHEWFGDCFRDLTRRGYERVLRVERINITKPDAPAAVCSIHIRQPDGRTTTRGSARALICVTGLASDRFARVDDALAGREA